jgi:acyl-CoA reductase-like NAD-dependent aldehyde dehydrogenase
MGQTIVRTNPADEREEVGRYQESSPSQVAAACERAAAAQPAWAATPGPKRGEILHRAAALIESRAERLAVEIVREEGKVLAEAAAEIARAIGVLRFHAGEAERVGGQLTDALQARTSTFTRLRPLGVVGLITPWNFPIAIPAWKLAPAIACGNAAVIKPSSLAPGGTLALLQALSEAGLPESVAEVVIGEEQIGQALVEDPRVKAVSFTGSTAVGQMLSRQLAERGVRFQGELGGNNPLVVLADAQIQHAAELACQGAFGAAGQRCTATSRLIVQEAAYEPLLAAVVARTKSMRLGDGLSAGVEVPPLITRPAAAEVLAAVEQARELGAQVATGGVAPDGPLRHGSFVEPTVLTDTRPGMKVIDQEVFGPVCSMTPARDLREAIELANAVPYGLSASICTSSLRSAFEFIASSQAGIVQVNRPTPGGDPHMPFGGMKASSASGWREQGQAAALFFTEQQTVYLHHGAEDLSVPTPAREPR